MNLLARYFADIVLSSINPLFFRGAVRRSAFSAFGYFVFFTFLHGLALSLAGALWLSHNFGPSLDQIQMRLPNFMVNLTGGELSTTLPQPFGFGDRDFILIVDTTDRTKDLNHYKSAVLIEKTKAVFKKDAVETREYSYLPIPDFSLTARDAIQWLKAHQTNIVWGLFSLFALFLFPLFWTCAAPAILILAIPFFILAKIILSSLRFGQVLTILFLPATLPTLVGTPLVSRGPASRNSWWLIYLVWTAIGILVCWRVEPPEAQASSTTSSTVPSPGPAPSR